jgi:hypothetical protein
MYTTLFLVALFPPPSSGSDVFSGPSGARAWSTADASISAIVQLVVRESVGADIVPDGLLGPVGERIELQDATMKRVYF